MPPALGGVLAIALAWCAFGALHSLLSRAGVKRVAERLLGPAFLAGLYRPIYSLLSFLILLWVWIFPLGLAGDVTFLSLPAPLRPLPFLVKGAAVLLIAAAFRQISFWEFLGTGQLLQWMSGALRGAAPTAEDAPPMAHALEPLAHRGVYLWVRHPLNTAAFVWIWAQPDYTLYNLAFAASLTAYILISNRFEERDLIRRYGAPYLRYREVVPAFFSLPWGMGARKRLLGGAQAPAGDAKDAPRT